MNAKQTYSAMRHCTVHSCMLLRRTMRRTCLTRLYPIILQPHEKIIFFLEEWADGTEVPCLSQVEMQRNEPRRNPTYSVPCSPLVSNSPGTSVMCGGGGKWDRKNLWQKWIYLIRWYSYCTVSLMCDPVPIKRPQHSRKRQSPLHLKMYIYSYQYVHAVLCP